MRNKTFVIGCGRLGAKIAFEAHAKGEYVTVIDTVESSFERLSESFAGFTETCDATDIKSLEDLGMADAKEVIITTGDDNVNLFLAHVMVEVFEVPTIYVRFDDPEFASLIDRERVKAIYPFELSFDAFNLIKEEGVK